MLISELEQQLKTGKPAPVYLVHGPESFLQSEAVRLIRRASEKLYAGLDVTEMDAPATDTGRFMDDLRTPSLFAGERLIIVSQAELLFAAGLEPLTAYARKPASRTILVLLAQALRAKLPPRARKKKDEPAPANVNTLRKACVEVECASLKRNELPSWCVTRARLLGKKLDSGATSALTDLIGTNLGELNAQISSLATLCRDRDVITRADVERLAGGDHARTMWDMLDALRAGQPASALRALDRILRDGQSEVWILTTIAREVQRAIEIALCQQQRMRMPDIAAHLGAPAWQLEKCSPLIRRHGLSGLRRNLRLLAQADVNMKTGADQRWVLEDVVLRLSG